MKRKVLGRKKNPALRKIAQQRLRRGQSAIEFTRKKYLALYDLAPVGYFSLDRGGLIREINSTAANILGQASSRLKGSRFVRFVEADLREKFDRFCSKIFESGKRHEMELRLLPRNKLPVAVLLAGIVIHDCESDSNLCQIAITDVSARVAAEAWGRRLIETTQDAVIAIDARAKIVLFNGAAERIFGYGAEEMIGKKINLLIAEPDQSELDRSLARIERGGEKSAIGKIRELSARRKNREIFPIELTLSKAGEGPHYAAFIRDVSERAKLQGELLERTRLATIGEAAAKAAHEISNPLDGIAMGVELFERQLLAPGDEAGYGTLKRTRDELSRLQRLLMDFRHLSAEPKYNRRPVSVSDLVDDVCALQKPLYALQGIQVEVEMAVLPQVLADADRIQQVLLNLCKNAEEAMPDRGKLTLRGFRAKGFVNLEVRDTGCGIPAGIDVFLPFNSTKPESSGLGLAVARQIVAAHGGTLTYTSRVGKGTTFLLALPEMPKDPEREGFD